MVEEFNDIRNTEASDADRRWGPVTPPVGRTNYLLIYPLIAPLIFLLSACFLKPTEGGPFLLGINPRSMRHAHTDKVGPNPASTRRSLTLG